MVFITTGQRIATENFADGVIYKVTFVDTTISYMMCVGIGQDFVMLQGPNPSLFCLTMSSASRVSTIDVHDPTPPEPPTPLENVLQYQTGEPPFTFTTTESSLFSWYIEGPCGVETANLLNRDTGVNGYLDDEGNFITPHANLYTSDYIVIPTGTEYVTQSLDSTSGMVSPAMCFYDSTKTFISGEAFGGINIKTFTVPNNAYYLRTCYRSTFPWVMLNVGSTALPYEPYGYKISILSNEHAETIYLDEALAEGERLYSVNIDTVIVTDIGENTLSVTPTPPEMQIVYGIYAEG